MAFKKYSSSKQTSIFWLGQSTVFLFTKTLHQAGIFLFYFYSISTIRQYKQQKWPIKQAGNVSSSPLSCSQQLFQINLTFSPNCPHSATQYLYLILRLRVHEFEDESSVIILIFAISDQSWDRDYFCVLACKSVGPYLEDACFIIKAIHNQLAVSHPGMEQTLNMIQCYYYWLCMQQIIEQYI